MDNVKQETNKFKRWWIWLWYNDITRIVFIVFGGHLLLTIPLVYWFVGDWKVARDIGSFVYIIILLIACMDNDYHSNLRRIGLTANRKPIKQDSEN